MARLEKLGITIDLGQERLDRIRQTFPDLTVQVELDLERAAASLQDVDAFVGRARHVSLLSNAPRLRWVQKLTAGADAASLPDIAERGILLTNGSGIHAPNLAEHVLGLMLAFARGLPQLIRAQERRQWFQDLSQFELNGQTLCVVGLGDIGLALADRAASIGMHVTGVRRRDLPVPDSIQTVVQLDNMDELLAQAHHVAICLPLTEDTKGVFDARRLSAIRREAFLYNVGRGEIIDHEALIELLRSGCLGGAGLDVTLPEPLPADSPLWDLDNVVITSHTGGRSPRRLDRFVDLLVDNISRYRAGEPLRNVVDLAAGY